MKRVTLDNQTRLIAIKRNYSEIDYYIVTPGNERIYAFTRPFSQKTWSVCRSGIRVNDLMSYKSKDNGMMLLVKHTKFMMPYLCEEYGLKKVG